MKKHKWYVSLSLASILLGNVAPVVLAEDVTSIATKIDSELLTHQVKEGDKLSDIAKQLKIEEELLKLINSRSKFKLSNKGNWAVLHKKRYLILADAHFHDYAIYDLKTPDTAKDLPYSKIPATDELKQLILQLHEQLGHLDGSGHDHSHDGHNHSHDGHDHSHDGHNHSHDGHDHSHEGHSHSHDGHDHSHEGHSHSHDGHDHSHDGHSHSHDGLDHSHDGHNHSHGEHDHSHDITNFKPEDVVSEDENGYVIKHGDHFHYVPKAKMPQPTPSEPNKPNTEAQQPAEPKPETKYSAEMDAKLTYIALTHGVPKESIVVSPTGYFVLSTPGHDFDPTHIHPIAIPIERVVVPEVTGNPETDFENEVKAMSHLTGIPVFALKIENNKFLVPHGDHDHYLNVIAVDGIKPYLDSLLPRIQGTYVPGDLSVDAVKNKVNELLQSAKERYKDDAKQLDRIQLALDAFNYDLANLPDNSTQGYLSMLDKFNQQYITKDTTPAPEETQPENDAYNKKYAELTESIRQLDLRGYSITRDQLITRLHSAKDEASLEKVGSFIEELNHARPTKVYSIKYLDYFLANIEKPYINNELREEMADLINLTFRAQFYGRKVTAEQLMDRLIETRQKVQQASEKNEVNEERVDGEHYNNLITGENQSASKDAINTFLADVRDFVQSFDSKFIPNVTPKEPAKPTDDEMTANEAKPEETDTTASETETSSKNTTIPATSDDTAETPSDTEESSSPDTDSTDSNSSEMVDSPSTSDNE